MAMRPMMPRGKPKPKAAPVKAGQMGGMIAAKPPAVKAFGHPAPDLKQIATDRGPFKIKG